MTQTSENKEKQQIRKKKWPRFVAIPLLCVLLIVTAMGWLHPLLGKSGLNRLNSSNVSYLDQSLKKALGTFGVLSAVKVGLAVVEGTELGVGFGVEVGDVVQSAYDYIDLAWRAVLTSAGVLLGTRYLLDAADLLGPLFLMALWAVLLIKQLHGIFWLRSSTAHRIFTDLSLLLVVLSLALYLVLPLSVAGGSLLSERIIRPGTEEAESQISELKEDLFPGSAQNEDQGVLKKLNETKDRLNAIASYLTKTSSDLSMWILRLIAGYLFDSLIFPLFLFVFLMWLTKTVARYLFHLQNQSSFRNDLEQLFVRYYKRAHAPFQGDRL